MFFDKNDVRQPPDIAEEQVTGRLETDVVIIGGGHAGTQCALAAAENGLRVVVVESRAEDKMSWLGEQIGAFNSRYHLEHGFGPYDTDDIIDELYRCSGYLANPVLIAKYVENSGEMIDNMMSLVPGDSTLFQDDQFNIQQAWGNPQYPVRYGGHRSWAATMIFRGPVLTERGGPEFKYQFRGSDYQVGERSRLPEFEMLALRRSRELGAKWLFGTKAVALKKSGEKVTGAICETGGGYTEIRASIAVVLSSGNFSPTGLELGLWAGGYTEPVLNLKPQLTHVENGLGTVPFLTLNRDGKRFMDESIPYAVQFAIDRQPDGPVCCVTDSNYLEQIKRVGLQHGNPDFGRPEFLEQFIEDMGHVAGAGKEGYLVRDLNTSEREKHIYYGADTLEELADYLGYSGAAKAQMLESVRRYNSMCYAGRDTDFRKSPDVLLPVDSPPYYGVRSVLKRKNAKESGLPLGLMTDDNFCVLSVCGDPIDGLYAVGNCLGGRYGTYYPTPCGGNFIGSAMTHGRVLGKYLAAMGRAAALDKKYLY